jgi:hypothetical protein
MGKCGKQILLERKGEPLVPLGQVRSKANWEEGRGILVYCVLLMHELIVEESSLVGKKHENLIIWDFTSLMCVK